MSRIKSFDSFHSVQNNDLNEDSLWGDITSFFGKILPVAGEGFLKTIKQKIAAAMIEKVGVKENSLLSGLIQELVAAIPISDIPGIVIGKKTNMEYLAPLFAETTQNFIQRKGLETLLEPLGAEPNGWLVATVRNSLQGELGKKNLEKAFLSLLGDDSIAKEAMQQFSPEEREKYSSELAKRAMQRYPMKYETGSTPGQEDKKTDFGSLTNLFSGIFGASGNK